MKYLQISTRGVYNKLWDGMFAEINKIYNISVSASFDFQTYALQKEHSHSKVSFTSLWE